MYTFLVTMKLKISRAKQEKKRYIAGKYWQYDNILLSMMTEDKRTISNISTNIKAKLDFTSQRAAYWQVPAPLALSNSACVEGCIGSISSIICQWYRICKRIYYAMVYIQRWKRPFRGHWTATRLRVRKERVQTNKRTQKTVVLVWKFIFKSNNQSTLHLQRSCMATPERAESMCLPHPDHVAFLQLPHWDLKHIFDWNNELIEQGNGEIKLTIKSCALRDPRPRVLTRCLSLSNHKILTSHHDTDQYVLVHYSGD